MRTLLVKYYPINKMEPEVGVFKMRGVYPADSGEKDDFNSVFGSKLFALREDLERRYDKEHNDELERINEMAIDEHEKMLDDPEEDMSAVSLEFEKFKQKREKAVNEFIANNKKFARRWNTMFKSEKFPEHHFFEEVQILIIETGDYNVVQMYGLDIYREFLDRTVRLYAFHPDVDYFEGFAPKICGGVFIPAGTPYEFGKNYLGDELLIIGGLTHKGIWAPYAAQNVFCGHSGVFYSEIKRKNWV